MIIHRIPAIFIIAVCIAASIATVNAGEDSSFQQDAPIIGMPDPSAVFAQHQGYQYVTRTNIDGSQYGIAVLPDGSEYDAWELFRESLQPVQDAPIIGMPDPSAVFAQQQGYQYVTRTNLDGSQYGIAVLPDGSEYDAWDLYRVTEHNTLTRIICPDLAYALDLAGTRCRIPDRQSVFLPIPGTGIDTSGIPGIPFE